MRPQPPHTGPPNGMTYYGGPVGAPGYQQQQPPPQEGYDQQQQFGGGSDGGQYQRGPPGGYRVWRITGSSIISSS